MSLVSVALADLFRPLLRPPGGGIPTFSAGVGAALVLQREYYSLRHDKKALEADDAAIRLYWEESWSQLAQAKCVLLGVPSDTGAGIRRGAAYGPRAVRKELLKNAEYLSWIQSGAVVDLGDVFVNPHLLHDEMLSSEQIDRCREAMYPDAAPELRKNLAVSALSQLKQVLSAISARYPHLKFFVIGGDHSVAWPVTEAMAEKFPGSLGIVQPDAHTDLLPSRLGVKYCFGTWSYHAIELLGRGGKLVQLGIRQTGRDKAHWESTTGTKQYWASEINSRSVEETVADLVQHLKARGVKQIYFSNDIDGTDQSEASATGTPVSEGLDSKFLFAVIERLGREFDLVAADIMEVAPDLAQTPEERVVTCDLAARYAVACLRHQVRPSDVLA